MNQYKAVSGARLSDDDAQRYGERIESLLDDNDDLITAEIVVEDAKHETSPLHDYFEWDDTVAAKEYRLHRARHLLRSITIVVNMDSKERVAIAFENIRMNVDDTYEKGYASILRVMSSADLREKTVEKALRELQSWQRRYKDYSELSSLFEAIDSAQIALPITTQ